ncbi:uncharacterized protein LOC105697793 [Orussus abietinus]|uniref:uncharacterized protein LOC105697793 n=1 Tax=Orussus abietinus TaxID=222816 RepID=UPI000C715F70|nr:uncharacterized protein LOC105697793 [Orussus abietinus]
MSDVDEAANNQCNSNDRRNVPQENEGKFQSKKFMKFKKKYPELFRNDVSIHPSYTELKNLPYYVVCRRRVSKKNKDISRHINREVSHFALMQAFALGSVRVDRIFSIGFTQQDSMVKDFATANERRRINTLVGNNLITFHV